jgi:WD40 repeat protein
MDPIITYRGHTMGVTKVEISAEQGRLYSSSLDSTIRVWQLPPADKSPYSPYGKILVSKEFNAAANVDTLSSIS